MLYVYGADVGRHQYTIIDNELAWLDISDAAKVLYFILKGHNVSKPTSDVSLCNSLNWSRSKLTRAKQELVSIDLLYLKKIGPTSWSAWVGVKQLSASRFYNKWTKNNRGQHVNNMQTGHKPRKY